MEAQDDLIARWDYSLPWYHGSPSKIDLLLPGSTITQDIDLARIFSHKPQIVCFEDDPAALARSAPRLRHNGTLPGLLYRVIEPLCSQDIFPHPRSSMAPGLEWLIRRPLRLLLLGPVEISRGEILLPEEIDEIIERMKGKRK
jgi:hypothetical protein